MNAIIEQKRCKWKRRITAVLVLCGLSGLLLVLYHSSNPSGVYYDGNVASGGAYWVFKDGRVYLKTPETYEFINTYSKSEGRWIGGTVSTNEQFFIKPSLLGVKLESTTHKNDRFIPRRGFSWLFISAETNR